MVWLLTGGVGAADPPAPAFKEYQVKAVFLLNFAQYVEWPAAAFAGPQSPIIIGVLGKDPFGTVLDTVIRGEVIRGRPVQVRRAARWEAFPAQDDLPRCHILFLSASEHAQVPALLTRLADRPILTVSDLDPFASQCGMVRFVTKANRIGLRINLEAATRAGLKLDSRLLELAEIVRCAPRAGVR